MKEPVPIVSPLIRILKSATCPSVSGKSTLTYHLGCDPQAELLIRVFANTGGGFFSQEWIPLQAIQQLLEAAPKDKPITSFALKKLFKAKSVNSTGFLLAILKREGVIRPLTDKQRCYEALDMGRFIAEAKTLIETAVNVQVSEQAKLSATTKRPAAKAKPA